MFIILNFLNTFVQLGIIWTDFYDMSKITHKNGQEVQLEHWSFGRSG